MDQLKNHQLPFHLGTIINFKGILLGIYEAPNLSEREDIGIIFWQNHTQTKIKQNTWKSWNTNISELNTKIFHVYSAIVYNHYGQ